MKVISVREAGRELNYGDTKIIEFFEEGLLKGYQRGPGCKINIYKWSVDEFQEKYSNVKEKIEKL